MRIHLVMDPNITGPLKEGVERANQLLREKVLNRAREPVRAEWSLGAAPAGRPVVTLKLTDHTGAEDAHEFSPGDFAQQNWLSMDLLRLWSSVLEKRQEKQLESLLSSANGEQGG